MNSLLFTGVPKTISVRSSYMGQTRNLAEICTRSRKVPSIMERIKKISRVATVL